MAFENTLKRHGRVQQNRSGQKPNFEISNLLGVNYADSIYNMSPNQSPYAKNVDFGSPIGTISKVDGYEMLFASLGAGKVQGLHTWQHSSGDKMLEAWDKYLYLLSGDTGSIAKGSQADWEAWTLSNIETADSPGNITLTNGVYSNVVTATADFNGTHSGTVAGSDKVSLTSAVVAAEAATIDVTFTSSLYYNLESGTFTLGQTFTAPADARVITKIIVKGCRVTTTGTVTLTLYYDADKGQIIGSKSMSISTDGDKTFTFDTPLLDIEGGHQYYYELSTEDAFININVSNGAGPYADGNLYYHGALSVADMGFSVYTIATAYGTYTHGVLDVSTEIEDAKTIIAYNKTEPAGSRVKLQTRVSADEGATYTAWADTATSATLIAANIDKSLYRVQWRAFMDTYTNGNNPSLNDVTVTHSYVDAGTGLSPVYDLVNTPDTCILSFTRTEPTNATATVYAAGSDNSTIFGDWIEVVTSGDSIPKHRYVKLKIIMNNTSALDTPVVSDFLISYSTAFTKANRLDISPLSRTDDLLTGSRVRFASYQDWLLMADGLRPFLAYYTTDTQATGTAQAGAASTITLAAGASAVNKFYCNTFVTTTGGTGSGQTRWISGYVGSTKVATVSEAWTVQPDATTTYSIGSALRVRNLGVDPPTTAATGAATATAGLPNGDYLLKYTYVNADGVESNPSPASATVTTGLKQITWTVTADTTPYNTTVKRRLYRTVDDGSVYKFLAEIDDNTTTTYTDNTADTALGSLMLDNNNMPPANCTLVYEFNAYVFYVDRYDVWYSKAGAPDQVPNVYGDIQMIPVPDEDLVIKHHPYALLFSGENFTTTNTASGAGFIFDSDASIDTTIMRQIDNVGGLSQEAAALCISPDLRSTVIINTNTGIRATVPGLQDGSLESVPLSKNIQPYYDKTINRDQAAACFYHNYYIYSCEYQESMLAEPEHLTFAYDLRTNEWYGPWEFGMSCFAVCDNVLYAGDTATGKLYRMFTGQTFAGAAIDMVCDLPMKAPASEAGSCKFLNFMAMVDSISNTAATYMTPKVDERASSPIALGALTTTYTGDVRPGHNLIRTNKYRIPLPAGHTYSLRITDNSVNPLKIEKIITEYERLAISK